jgi:hypothetical protein
VNNKFEQDLRLRHPLTIRRTRRHLPFTQLLRLVTKGAAAVEEEEEEARIAE